MFKDGFDRQICTEHCRFYSSAGEKDARVDAICLSQLLVGRLQAGF